MNMTDEQKTALIRLRATFRDFVATGGLSLDRTHQLGSAYAILIEMEENMSKSNIVDSEYE